MTGAQSKVSLAPSKFTSTSNVTSILGESEHLKEFSIKAWLRKLARKQEAIQKKYLMNLQEVLQNEKIERLFVKFDTDGSGALDPDEMYVLFKQNNCEIPTEVLQEMFNHQAFTLRAFKDINDSP